MIPAALPAPSEPVNVAIFSLNHVVIAFLGSLKNVTILSTALPTNKNKPFVIPAILLAKLKFPNLAATALAQFPLPSIYLPSLSYFAPSAPNAFLIIQETPALRKSNGAPKNEPRKAPTPSPSLPS